MKKEDIEATKEGELEKVTGWHYESGKGFASIDREPSPEEQHQENLDRIKAGECLRCGRPLKKETEFCEYCGLKKL